MPLMDAAAAAVSPHDASSSLIFSIPSLCPWSSPFLLQELALARNRARQGAARVPEPVLRHCAAMFEPPAPHKRPWEAACSLVVTQQDLPAAAVTGATAEAAVQGGSAAAVEQGNVAVGRTMGEAANAGTAPPLRQAIITAAGQHGKCGTAADGNR